MIQKIVSMLVLVFLFPAPLIAKPLVVGTWNMEHLAEVNGAGCRSRTTSDYLALKRYADSLNADVIGLQEVQNIKAVQRVFSPDEYYVIVSERPSTGSYPCRGNRNQSTEQRVGWAIKKGIKYEYTNDMNILSLSINGYQRYGLALFLPDENLYLLNLHLKSQCFDIKLPSPDPTCMIKEIQVERVLEWLTLVEGSHVVLLGDWNRQLANEGDYIAKQFDNFTMTTKSLKGCNPKYPKPIDHILTSFTADKASFHAFGDDDGVSNKDVMLSDHCAATVRVNVKP